LKLRAAALSNLGLHRTRNEDRWLADLLRGIFGVADGVGGMPGGAEAAQAAKESLEASFAECGLGQTPDLEVAVQRAHAAVIGQGKVVNPGTGIATTLTVGAFRGDEVELAHVGDSRCYCWFEGRLTRLTRDHSQGRVLTRCLGLPEPLEVEIQRRTTRSGERYLFCTDGLTNYASEADLARIVGQSPQPQSIVDDLIAAALRGGGGDNVTAVAVLVG
jgi:serine/threonine protein phosphatase PrpC